MSQPRLGVEDPERVIFSLRFLSHRTQRQVIKTHAPFQRMVGGCFVQWG